MKPIMKVVCGILSSLLLFSVLSAEKETKIDLADIDTVPDGNYLVTWEIAGKTERLNLEIKNNRAKCVNASRPEFKSVRGIFEAYPRQLGAFVGRFEGENDFRATQLWIFRPDGKAAIRETPDRGEMQSAVPVEGTTIEAPKEKAAK